MAVTSDLPSFPCWCRATYSWGGETKKDLGFIEGDLIEALNAGDGAWWMGRLRRDPRATGLFPSNFVQVMDESFRPAPNNRNQSPVTQGPGAQQQRSSMRGSVFRKPFQAYGEVGKREGLENVKHRESTPDSDKEKEKARKSKFRPYSSMKTAQAPTGTIKKQGGQVSPIKQQETGFRVPSPPPRGGRSRAASPLPARQDSASMHRTASPRPGYNAPVHPTTAASRPHSPLPSSYHDGSSYPQMLPSSRQPSPNPYQQLPSARQPSPNPYQQLPSARHPSPNPYQQLPPIRQPSPNPYQQLPPIRQPSPNPYPQLHHEQSFRSTSATPDYGYNTSRAPGQSYYHEEENEEDTSPPPPPPTHRVAYQPSRAPSPQPYQDEYSNNRTSTPQPPASPGPGNMTPSPLRDAMNDVMSSLQDMSGLEQIESAHQASLTRDVWSPDTYDIVRSRSRRQARARSTLGFARPNDYFYEEDHDGTQAAPHSQDGPPQLDDFVQRMEQQLHYTQSSESSYPLDQPPAPPLKGSQFIPRPATSDSQSSTEISHRADGPNLQQRQHLLNHRKSAYELGPLNRTYTTKTSATNSTVTSSATQSSNSTQLTSRSLMSGYSAGGFSATSAGSLARRKFPGMGSQHGRKTMNKANTKSNPDIGSSARSLVLSASASDAVGSGSGSGPSYHESHASENQQQPSFPPLATPDWTPSSETQGDESSSVFGGLSAPKTKKSSFFRKMIDSAKTTAKTGAATARSTMGSRPGSRSGPSSPSKSLSGGFGGGSMPSRPGSSVGGGGGGGDAAARDMGLGGAGSGGNDWMQVRRDVNRSNSLSRREMDERAERCEMMDITVLNPIDQLYELAEGDESLDGLPIAEPMDFNAPNLALVDKSTRFIQSVPPMINAAALAQSYICRPHRTDVQRLRAIFIWVAERVTWEDDFEGEVDVRRVVQTRRGCSEEIAVLVRDMCNAVGLHAEIVRGYLKAPGESLDLETLARPNHWWNAVIVDGEWRIMDCSLAGPTNPRRSAYTSASSQVAESWYFLARPLEICYTHIPLLPEQQHIVPPVPHELLIALPCACPPYFRNSIELADFTTSTLHLENLEMAHIHITVPEDVECTAEVEARGFAQDIDGDYFESGDVVRKRAIAQPEWLSGRKRFTVKAVLPGDEGGQGTLKIYAGKRGLMHSIKDNPHALALALPLSHTGQNPPYNFLIRHPTTHAQRHDLYVAQPQCAKLVLNNTFVFAVRQHPSSLSRFTPDTWGASNGGPPGAGVRPSSPNPYVRPTSAMSMVSASASHVGSNYSDPSSSSAGGAVGGAGGAAMSAAQQKPAKLAIQSPSQKIIRLTRKLEHGSRATLGSEDQGLSTSWETVIKVGERGTWRGLVLADRSARWCVFAEWECV